MAQEFARREPKVLSTDEPMTIGYNGTDRPTNRAVLALERKKGDDLAIGFEDGDLNIIPYRSDDLCKLGIEIRAGEIRVRLLQRDPDTNEVVTEVTGEG